jgi:hypothetical protein
VYFVEPDWEGITDVVPDWWPEDELSDWQGFIGRKEAKQLAGRTIPKWPELLEVEIKGKTICVWEPSK